MQDNKNDSTRNAMTVSEFCDKYRIHRTTYYRNARRGRMPPITKIGGSSRILGIDEDVWMYNQRGRSHSGGPL